MGHHLITIAIQELGVLETPGPEHTARIMEYAEEAGFPDYTQDEIAWCSLFMNWVALKGKMKRTHKLTARSWLNVGINVDDHPEPGDIVIYWRGAPNDWRGHVGIFIGYSKDGSRIYTLGGNQNNRVSISAYRANRLLGFRRLEQAMLFNLEEVVLKRGDIGPLVAKLQDALKLADMKPGTSDGHFGPKTEGAVKDFQRTFAEADEQVTGIFDAETREELLAVINA
ncbi:MAG: TIGR02594 family protein [Bacteroidota bacterium]